MIAEGLFADQFARLGGRRWMADAVAPVTDPGTVTLHEGLAAGDSIEIAAAKALMSLRTATRRLAQARAHFTVLTTLEAVLAQGRASQP